MFGFSFAASPSSNLNVIYNKATHTLSVCLRYYARSPAQEGHQSVFTVPLNRPMGELAGDTAVKHIPIDICQTHTRVIPISIFPIHWRRRSQTSCPFNMQLSFCALLLFVISAGLAAEGKRVVCYYRWNHAGLAPADLPDGCTHIIISFAAISAEMTLNLSQVGNADVLKEFVESYRLKQSETYLLISVGGAGSAKMFSQVTSSQENTKTFIDSIKEVLNYTGLDGVDFDWEFPCLTERNSFSSLLKETSVGLEQLSNATGKAYILSVALPGPFTMALLFDTTSINKYCTFASVMTYDLLLYNRVYMRKATLHSALDAQASILNPFSLYTVRSSMAAWKAIDKDKLNLGLPTYAVAYQLCDPKKTSHLSCIKGYSPLGSNVNYKKICSIRETFPQNDQWQAAAKAPYIFDNESNWFTYDNERSITLKTKYAVDEGFGGLMVFSLNADDHAGACGAPAGRFPLLKAALTQWS